MKWLVLSVLVAVASHGGAAKIPKLPGNHIVCFRNEPQFDKCFAGSLQNLFRAFSKDGAPELGLKPFDPLRVPQMLVEYDQGSISGKMLIKDTMTTGFNNIRVTGVRSQFEENSFEMDIDVQFPSLFIEGSYESEGNIVVFPINGNGVFNISMRDISGTWKLRGTPQVQLDDRTYVKLDNFLFRPKVGSMKIYASNLFTGNDALNQAALAFANQFWPAIYDELLPYAEQSWNKIMTNIANQIFLKVPFDEVFPVL